VLLSRLGELLSPPISSSIREAQFWTVEAASNDKSFKRKISIFVCFILETVLSLTHFESVTSEAVLNCNIKKRSVLFSKQEILYLPAYKNCEDWRPASALLFGDWGQS
jgi:hypothetical protein